MGIVATRQSLMDLLELRFNQVKVIKQPLCSRGDVLSGVRDRRYVVIGLPERLDIFFNSREKR